MYVPTSTTFIYPRPHTHRCLHASVSYCAVCGVTYCNTCSQEWGGWTYQYQPSSYWGMTSITGAQAPTYSVRSSHSHA